MLSLDAGDSDEIEETSDDEDANSRVGLAQALRTLPLFTEMYLHMQAMNLDLVDRFIEDQETRLLHEYLVHERTPFPSTIFVSALCQLWIFGLYELLRTWRQRGKDILRWSKDLNGLPEGERPARLLAKRREIEKRAADPDEADVFHWPRSEERRVGIECRS